MRTLRCALVVIAVVACKKGDAAAADSPVAASAAPTPAASPATAPPGARWAGRWVGVGYVGSSTKGEAFTVVADSGGTMRGIGDGDTTTFRMLSSTDTSFALESPA